MKTRIVNFRATDKLVKDLEDFIRMDGHYRNRSEIINEVLRTFLRSNHQSKTNNDMRVKKK